MGYQGNYDHYVPPAKINPDYPSKFDFILVETLDQLAEVLENESKYMAWDIEATGLDQSRDDWFIVGVALCFGGKTGYYVPVKHLNALSLGQQAVEMIFERMKKNVMNFLFNVRFDYRCYEWSGIKMDDIPYYDVSVGVNFADSNVKMPSLKWAALHFLGWEMIDYASAVGDGYNLYYADPKDVALYAGGDALATFHLANTTLRYYKEGKISAQLDNKILFPLMRFEDDPLLINYQRLEDMTIDVLEEEKALEREIIAAVGYSFKIGSPAQLSQALQSIGVDTGETTKTGNMKTGIDLLEAVNNREPNPILEEIVRFKKLSKLRTSYTSTLAQYARDKQGRLRFSYHTGKVPTGRLASGADKKNTYFAKINIQSIPKPKGADWYVHELPEGMTYEDAVNLWPDDEIVLDYRFSLNDKSKMKVEGFTPKMNVRHCFEPEEGHYWVSMDFQA